MVFGRLLVALIGGLIAGILASRKNRSVLGWGVAGALSFALALIVLAFMPYKCDKCRINLTNDQWSKNACPSCKELKAKAAGDTGDSNPAKPSRPRLNLVEPVKQTAISSSDEELIYERAANELASASYKKGLWAKSIADADGDEKVAKARYVKARSLQLLIEHKEQLDKTYELQMAKYEEAKHAAVLEQQRIDDAAPKGRCPNCNAAVRMTATKCHLCPAVFSGTSSWKPTPMV